MSGASWIFPITIGKTVVPTLPNLCALTAGGNANKKKQKVQWSVDCQEAFKNLKYPCSNTKVLAYANYSKPFKLCTDASGDGLGWILYQRQDEGIDNSYSLC